MKRTTRWCMMVMQPSFDMIAYDTYQPGKINPLVYAADPKFTNLGDMGIRIWFIVGIIK